MKQRRKKQQDQGNRVFEDHYNKLVDDYAKNAGRLR